MFLPSRSVSHFSLYKRSWKVGTDDKLFLCCSKYAKKTSLKQEANVNHSNENSDAIKTAKPPTFLRHYRSPKNHKKPQVSIAKNPQVNQ